MEFLVLWSDRNRLFLGDLTFKFSFFQKDIHLLLKTWSNVSTASNNLFLVVSSRSCRSKLEESSRNKMALAASKTCNHLRLSPLWPPTSKTLKRKNEISLKKYSITCKTYNVPLAYEILMFVFLKKPENNDVICHNSQLQGKIA